MYTHLSHLSPLVCACQLTHPGPIQCLNSIQHVFSEGKNGGEYRGLPRSTVTFAWSFFPVSPLYDTYQDCAPTSVQGDGNTELVFKLRRLINKPQLAPWKHKAGEGFMLPGKPSFSRRQLDKDMEQMKIRIWGTTFKAWETVNEKV